ncbi:TIGR03571 family LLM class oxidoreductase [Corynebacterium sputi]|uniref:TIGR03571 family LLM class oxidoreductase n=1 Tax=Corynebacterium sputi TaxID=489915 RepID=UPI000416D8BD|nr:TIGR03571 family LLM class oxidoreductase [Corynebacterium sputi]
MRFPVGRLTLGIGEPLTNDGPVPDMTHDAERVRMVEDAGFHTLWFRDVPLHSYEFRDAGQIYDPFVHMAYVAACTSRIGLATAATVITLRHPIHVAKMAASLDNLSGGRLALGVATGDREEEFPAFRQKRAERAESFRDSMDFIRKLWRPGTPRTTANRWGGVDMGLEMLPKPSSPIPLLVTGNCGQSPQWIAENSDGWIVYGDSPERTATATAKWRSMTPTPLPYISTTNVDLLEDPDAPAMPLRYGFRAGRNFLLKYLETMEAAGVDHLIISLRQSSRPVPDVIAELGEHILPRYPSEG